MPLKHWMFMSLLCWVPACAASSLPNGQSPFEPAGPASSSPGVSAPKRSPLQLSLSGPLAPKAGEALPLTAEVARNVPFSVPIDVVLRLPKGLRLIEGQAVQQLLPNTRKTSDPLRFVIAADPLPDEDVVLTLDARGQSFGFHTEKAYRFGRAEPGPGAALPLGDDLKVGGHNAGPSVKLTPRPKQN